MENIKIILTDDHALFRNGLKMMLSGYDGLTIVGEASNGVELISLLENSSDVDVILLDISMPKMDGIEAASIIASRFPDIQILTLSMFGEEDYYFKMVSLGVKGFMLKNSSIDEVVQAIRTVADKGSYFSNELLSSLVDSLQYSQNSHSADEEESLSTREKEILFQICKGLNNQEIGEILFISKRTVDKHRANILAKTNCKNTANLVVYAIKNGLVEI